MKPIKQLLDSTAFFLLMLIWLVVFVIPRVIAELSPPVTNFRVVESTRLGEYVILTGVMVKNKCRFAGLSVYGITSTGREIHVPIEFLDTLGDVSKNRRKGAQTWGPWRITVGRAQMFTIESTHWCKAYNINAKWSEFSKKTVLVKNYPIPNTN